MSMHNTANYQEQGGASWVIGGSVDVTGTMKIAGTAVTPSAAELNILDGATVTTAELNKLDGVDTTAGAKFPQMQSNTIAYTNTTAKDLVTLPANAVIDDILVNVTTAFNDSGTDLLDIGLKGGAGDYYAADVDVSSAVLVRPSGITHAGSVGATAVTITGTYAGQNTNATAGAATVTVIYHV